MEQELILMGPFQLGQLATNGVSIKNRYFAERFSKLFNEVKIVDSSYVGKKYPLKTLKYFLRLAYYGMFHRNAKVVLSENIDFAYSFALRYLYLTRHGKNVYYWAPGGTLPKKIKDGNYNIKYYNSLRKIYVQGQGLVDKLNEMGIKNSIFVPNSKYIPALPKKMVNKTNVLRFVFVSRVHPTKGISEIAKCAEYLDNHGYKDRYIIDFYGSIQNGYENEFKDTIKVSANISYKGFLNLRKFENYNLLAKYDVMLFPTYWHGEGFPGVVIDSYIAGLPVIASDWNLNSEFVHDKETGVIIPVHNVEALREAMLGFLDGKYDLNKMSEKSQNMAMLYDNRYVLSDNNLKILDFLDK